MIKALIARYAPMKNCTPGALFVEGGFVCYTLEPVGDVAIPAGTYPLILADSPKFGPNIPHITNVPGRTNILIHHGNTAKDTTGCVCVGLSQGRGWIGDSRDAMKILVPMLDVNNEITIRNYEP